MCFVVCKWFLGSWKVSSLWGVSPREIWKARTKSSWYSEGNGVPRLYFLSYYYLFDDTSVITEAKPICLQPLINLFHSEIGNGQWKRRTDAALLHCTVSHFSVTFALPRTCHLVNSLTSCVCMQTMKSFLDEVLPAIPDFVLDSSVVKEVTGREDLFADVRRLMPPPYQKESPKELAEPVILDEEWQIFLYIYIYICTQKWTLYMMFIKSWESCSMYKPYLSLQILYLPMFSTYESVTIQW